jgi:integrase/recombinase XerC
MSTGPIERFLDYLHYQRNASPATLRAYGADLHHFQEFLRSSSSSARLDRVDPLAIRAWLTQLHQDGQERSSMSRKISSLRSFFR